MVDISKTDGGRQILVTWIGRSDLIAADKGLPDDDPGPVYRLLRRRPFTRAFILHDFVSETTDRGRVLPSAEQYRDLVVEKLGATPAIELMAAKASLRNDYTETFRFTDGCVETIRSAHRDAEFTLLLSPGTPAAQAAMIVAGQVRLPRANFVTSFRPEDASDADGIETVRFPFNVVYESVGRAMWGEPETEPHASFDKIVGRSKEIQSVKALATRLSEAAGGEAPLHVLLHGETGTGKELFANAMHEAGPRHKEKFVPLNSAGLSENLLESELFGHAKGAFTGAVADRPGLVATANGGTLFLDEIGDMPPAMQVKLLRFLDSGEYRPVGASETKKSNVWIIAATHKDLRQMVRDRTFRQDLYERLNGWTLRLPPLRRRRDDVPTLAGGFLKAANPSKRFSQEALDRLRNMSWPGNVRQLKQVSCRLALLCQNDVIQPDDVARWSDEQDLIRQTPIRELADRELAACLVAAVDALVRRFGENERFLDYARSDKGKSLGVVAEILESVLVARACDQAKGNLTAAATLIGKKSPLKDDAREKADDFMKKIGRHLPEWKNLSIIE